MIRIWFGYLAQLLSGRIFNSIMALGDRVRTLEGRVKEIYTMTPNEQKIVNAAQTIVSLAATFQTAFDTLKAENTTLVQKLAESNSSHEPEDLTEEFQQFDTAMEQMQLLAGTLTPAAPDASPGNGPVNAPVDVAVPDEVRPADPMNPPPGTEGTFNAPLPDAGVTTPVDNTSTGIEDQPVTIPAEVAPATTDTPIPNPDENQPVTEPEPVAPAAEVPETASPVEAEGQPKIDAPVAGDEGPVADSVPAKAEDDDDGWGTEPTSPGTSVG